MHKKIWFYLNMDDLVAMQFMRVQQQDLMSIGRIWSTLAEEVSKCLQTATFGGKPLLCSRGIKQQDFLFDDEKHLTEFLSLTEQGKEEFPGNYKVKCTDLLVELHVVCGRLYQ